MLRPVTILAAAAAFPAAVLPGAASAQPFDGPGIRALADGAARIERVADIDEGGYGGYGGYERGRYERGGYGRYGRDDGYRPRPPRVVYDERGPDARRDWRERREEEDGRPVYRRAPPPDGYGVVFERPFHPGYGPGPYGGPGPYRPVAVDLDPQPVGPVPHGPDFGRYPDGGCTIVRTRGVTPAGWRKTVTHRTCYAR